MIVTVGDNTIRMPNKDQDEVMMTPIGSSGNDSFDKNSSKKMMMMMMMMLTKLMMRVVMVIMMIFVLMPVKVFFFFFSTALLGTPLVIYNIHFKFNTKKRKEKKQKPKRGRYNGTNVPCKASPLCSVPTNLKGRLRGG